MPKDYNKDKEPKEESQNSSLFFGGGVILMFFGFIALSTSGGDYITMGITVLGLLFTIRGMKAG